MDSMPMLDDDFNYNEINLDFLGSPPRSRTSISDPNFLENNLKSSTMPENKPENPSIAENGKGEIDFCDTKFEIKDFNLDFLESPQKTESKRNGGSPDYQQSSCIDNITIKTENLAQAFSSKKLAKRIADVDTLVRQLRCAEEAKNILEKQMEDFNQSTKEVQLLYNKERNARIEAETKNKALEEQRDDLELELASKSLELDQVQAQMEDCNGPVKYSELALRFLKLAQKLDEERLLHWHDQPLYKDISKYCKDKNLKVPKIVSRSPPKRKALTVRKLDVEIQCDLISSLNPAKEVEKPKIQVRHQSTQSEQTETRNQGCQHIGTTTTRGTTTSCFFKYHDVGINCGPMDFEPAFNSILEEMHTFAEIVAPLSPITEIPNEIETMSVETILPLSPLPESLPILPNKLHNKPTCSIGINTNPITNVKRKSVGSCTDICNVQRPLDFMAPPPICIKRSNSRPPSTSFSYEDVKNEVNTRSNSSSPVNYNENIINNPLPSLISTASSTPAISPNAFDELWQIFGHMLYGYLNRPTPTLSCPRNGSTIPMAPYNITSQQDFYNWLHASYNNVETSQTNSDQSGSTNNSISSRCEINGFPNANTELASNRGMSHTSNENTPVDFSDAVPTAQRVENVMKPTALRNNLRNLNTCTEHNAYSSILNERKNTATSPIRFLNTTLLKCNEDISTKSLNKTNQNVVSNPVAKEPTASAFERTNTTRDKKLHLNRYIFKILKKSSLKRRKHKRLKLPKRYQSKMSTETAVDFLAKMSEISTETAVDFLAKVDQKYKDDGDQPAAPKLGSVSKNLSNAHLYSRKEKLPIRKQHINYKLFGSETESDTEIKPDAGNLSSATDSSSETTSEQGTDTNSSSCGMKETRLNQTNLSDIYESETLQIIDDVIEKDENYESSKNPQDLMDCEFKDEEVIINQFDSKPLGNENLFNIEQSVTIQTKVTEEVFDVTKAITFSNKFNMENDSKIVEQTPTKRGRKRKAEGVLQTTLPVILPSKRSARLLSKQLNEQHQQLSHLTLDFENGKLPETSKACSDQTLKKQTANMNENLVAINKTDITNETGSNVNKANSFALNNIASFPYTQRIIHTKSPVSTSPIKSKEQGHPNSFVNTLKTAPAVAQGSVQTKRETSNLELTISSINASILPLPTEAAVLLNNFNLKNSNISSLLTTPYAFKSPSNTLTIAAHATNSSTSINESLIKTYPVASTVSSLTKNVGKKSVESSIQMNNVAEISDKTTNSIKSEDIINALPSSFSNESAGIKPPASNFCFYETKTNTCAATTDMPNSPKDSFANFSTTSDDCASTVAGTQGLKIVATNIFENEIDIQRSSNSETQNCLTIISDNSLATNLLPASDDSTFTFPPNNSIESETSEVLINFDSSPASPSPPEIEAAEEVLNTTKNIPLELSVDNFPTWRRWRKHQRSLLHNLISVYDSKLYQGFKGNEVTKAEEDCAQQMLTHINECIRYITEIQTNQVGTASIELSVFHLIKQLQQITCEPKLIALAILKCIQKQQRPTTAAYEPYVKDAPTTTTTNATLIYDPLKNESFSTNGHRCCAYILQQVSKDTLTALMNLIESTLFDIKSSDTLQLYDALNLTDLYLLTLKSQSFNLNVKNPARLFIGKCLYYHKLKAAPMIYAVLCAFPTVLPHREERFYDRSDALITVIQHCLMCNTYDMNNSELLQRELLSKLRFQYHFECFKPDFQEVLKNLVDKLCAGKLENLKFAFAIFCKRLPPERVVRDVLQQHFIPLANEYYRLVEQNDAYEMRLASLLDCFSTVIKPFPRAHSATNAVSNEIQNYLNFFKRFLNIAERPLVREAAIHAILRLQRFDFLNCYKALAHLRSEFELQPNTRAALRTFIYRKPLSFWKALLLQNS